MIDAIIGIAVGIAAIILRAKAFTPKGLPYTNTQRITGAGGIIVGIVCIFIGLFFISGAIYLFMHAG